MFKRTQLVDSISKYAEFFVYKGWSLSSMFRVILQLYFEKLQVAKTLLHWLNHCFPKPNTSCCFLQSLQFYWHYVVYTPKMSSPTFWFVQLAHLKFYSQLMCSIGWKCCLVDHSKLGSRYPARPRSSHWCFCAQCGIRRWLDCQFSGKCFPCCTNYGIQVVHLLRLYRFDLLVYLSMLMIVLNICFPRWHCSLARSQCH